MPRVEFEKKISVEEAVGLYEEELDILAENCFYEVVDECYELYEEQQRKRIEMEINLAYEEKRLEEAKQELLECEEYWADVAAYLTEEIEDEVIDEVASDYIASKLNSNGKCRAQRRKNNVYHKIKFAKKAKIVEKAYSKLMVDDMFFTSSRGGVIRNKPKAKSTKADEILKRARKLCAVNG